MAMLRFTNPTDYDVCGDWDFKVLPAVIAIQARDMLDIYSKYLDDHKRFHSKIPKTWPRYTEAKRIAELHALLTQSCNSEQDVELDGHDYVWSLSSNLMFSRKFASVICPECTLEFGPAECSVLSWTFGGGLAASGGRRVVCPKGHTLYSCGEWNS